MKERYPSIETRKKICGALKAKYEQKDHQSPEDLVLSIKSYLKEGLDLRNALKKVFDMTPKERIIEKVNQIKIKEGSPKKEILKKISKNVLDQLNSYLSGLNDADEIIKYSESEKYKQNYITQKEFKRIVNYHLSRIGVIIPGTNKGWYGESERYSKARKTGKADFEKDMIDKEKKIKALRFGEYSESHRSMDTVIEILKWKLGNHEREKRQQWWNEMLSNFPEAKEYLGKTNETDKPEEISNDLLIEIGKFILEKEGNESIYSEIELKPYKIFSNRKEKTSPVLIMKGINVDPIDESLYMAYESGKGAVVEGRIIGKNTWEDGTVLADHKIIYKFNPNDPKNILKGLIRYKEIFSDYYELTEAIEGYNKKYYPDYYGEFYDDDSPGMEYIEKQEKKLKKSENIKNQGKGWFGESERHSKARKTGKADFEKDMKFPRAIRSMIKDPYFLDKMEKIELIDTILNVRDRIRNFDYDQSFILYDFLMNIEKFSDEKIMRMDRYKLINLFDSIRDAFHTTGSLLERLYPSLEPEIFEKLFKIREEGFSEGKGWFGESERHSKARKTGKADFTEDLDETFTNLGLKRTSPKEKKESNSGYIKKQIEYLEDELERIRLKRNKIFRKYGATNPELMHRKLDRLNLQTIEGYERLSRLKKALEKIETKESENKELEEENEFLLYNAKMLDSQITYKEQELQYAKDKLEKAKSIGDRMFYRNEIERREKEIKEDKKKYQLLPEEIRELQKKQITFKSIIGEKVSKKGKGWYGEPERHSKARKTGKADMTEDAESKPSRRSGRPRKRGLKAGTPSAKIGGAKTTKTGQVLKAKNIPLAVGNVNIEPVGQLQPITQPLPKVETPKFLVPFDVRNSETNVVVFGQRLEDLSGYNVEMKPLSSSNVKSSGQFNNELLVQFLSGQGTYRYQFGTPDEAKEARLALESSGSPGRWIWQNIRGHKAGEPVTSNKLGPAITSGSPTIGGTSASLVSYKLGGRTPVPRVQGFDEMLKQTQRLTANPTNNPMTGSRIEGELQGRILSRNQGKNIGRISLLRSRLPRRDFIKRLFVRKIKIEENPIKKARWKYVGKMDNFIQENHSEDLINLNAFNKITTDFKSDFTMFHGPITRAGPFDYIKEGKKVTLYKNWDNIKERFSEVSYLPYKLAQTGSHKAGEYGFAYNFTPNEETKQMFANIITLEDIDNLTEVIENMEDYHVSIGFEDHVERGDVQIIDKLDHLAGSGTEVGRCSTGGEEGKRDCIIHKLKNHDQNLMEVG